MATHVTKPSHRTFAPGNADLKVVSFRLAGDSYGVSVSDVHGIYHGLPLIPTEGRPDCVDGDARIGFERIPVVNLRRFAGMDVARPVGAAGWVLVVNRDKGLVGVVVDEVTEVVELSPATLRDVDTQPAGPVGGYVTGTALAGGDTIYFPDFSRLLNDAVNPN